MFIQEKKQDKVVYFTKRKILFYGFSFFFFTLRHIQNKMLDKNHNYRNCILYVYFVNIILKKWFSYISFVKKTNVNREMFQFLHI